MKRIIFLFIAIVLLYGCDAQTDSGESIANIATSVTTVSTTQETSMATTATQSVKENQPSNTEVSNQNIVIAEPESNESTQVQAEQVQTAKEQTTQAQITKEEITVYITKSGSKYHKRGCRYLGKSSIPIDLSDAKKKYDPCSVCAP